MAYGCWPEKLSARDLELSVPPAKAGERLDVFLSSALPELSRSRLKRLIEEGLVKLNQKTAEPSYKLRGGEKISLLIPAPEKNPLTPAKLPLNIIYEDQDLLVINKPRGLVVHPAPGNREGTLVQALLFHQKELAPTGGPLRPGIVHRLDKDTSGLLVVAKNDPAYHSLVKQLKERKVTKTYLALVHGVPPQDQGEITAEIGRHPVNRKKMSVLQNGKRRDALTRYKVRQKLGAYSLLEVEIKTGRTHQIRVHLTHLGCPIVGDQTYGKKNNPFGIKEQLLHAYKLAFDQPQTGERLEFSLPLPTDMAETIKKLTEGGIAGNHTNR